MSAKLFSIPQHKPIYPNCFIRGCLKQRGDLTSAKKVSIGIVVCVLVIAGLFFLWPKERLVTKNPGEIALRSTDVPPEWRADAREFPATIENAAVGLGTSVDNLQKWGYEAGFGSLFRTAGEESTISSAVARFSSVGGAKEMFAHRKRTMVGTEVTVAQEIGDERVGYTQTIWGSTMWGISFRTANVFVSLYVAGPTGTFSFENVITYAQIMEDRIR